MAHLMSRSHLEYKIKTKNVSGERKRESPTVIDVLLLDRYLLNVIPSFNVAQANI